MRVNRKGRVLQSCDCLRRAPPAFGALGHRALDEHFAALRVGGIRRQQQDAHLRAVWHTMPPDEAVRPRAVERDIRIGGMRRRGRKMADAPAL